MQVSGSLASSVSLSFTGTGAAPTERAPEAPAPEVEARPAADAGSPAPSRFDGMRDTVESLLARLQAGHGREVDVEGERVRAHHQHGEEHDVERADRHERRHVRKGLERIEHAVRDELKQLRKELDDPEARHEVKHLNHDFRHALRDLRHDVGHGEEPDGASLSEGVREAFEGLVTRLEGLFSGQSPAAVAEPDAPVADAVEQAPVEPIGTDEQPVDPGVTMPADPAAGLRDFLQAMTRRFESLLGELESLMPRPEELVPEATDAPAGMTDARFEMVFSAFAEVSFSFTVEDPGTRLDLAG